jgi:hypothetical protein
MKTILTTSAVVLALAAPAWAITVADLDTNGDGLVTIDEVQAAYPDTTDDSFAGLDTNGDGSLDDVELSVVQE